MHKCSTFIDCTAMSHTDKENCLTVMEKYYRVKGSIVQYVCPQCIVVEIGQFDSFYRNHGDHVRGFKVSKAETYLLAKGKLIIIIVIYFIYLILEKISMKRKIIS